MKALVLEGKDELNLRDFPVEEMLGPRDVRIALKTVGVCGSDVHYYTHGAIGLFVGSDSRNWRINRRLGRLHPVSGAFGLDHDVPFIPRDPAPGPTAEHPRSHRDVSGPAFIRRAGHLPGFHLIYKPGR
jgi:hypothetical protein